MADHPLMGADMKAGMAGAMEAKLAGYMEVNLEEDMEAHLPAADTEATGNQEVLLQALPADRLLG